MRLPPEWETFLDGDLDLNSFYNELDGFLQQFERVIPYSHQIFRVFEFIAPQQVRCVLFGEDPYPRLTSACGIAFWDKEIQHWSQKTNGNSLKNILKALLVLKGWADYNTPIEECRNIADQNQLITPPELFASWLDQGVLLVNTSLTFSNKKDKNFHLRFWKPFLTNLVVRLNQREVSPYYVLWGNHARKWERSILESIDDRNKIIIQNHPTFIHQFLDKNQPTYSPFRELMEKTSIVWI